MTTEIAPESIVVSLPRPQVALPPSEAKGEGRFESFNEMVKDAWKDEADSPSHAWVRYSLAAGLPLADFPNAFQPLKKIRNAFGRRVLIRPVRMDHHEIELPDFIFLTNPLTGCQEIECDWRKKRCDGGTHIFFAVESTAEEAQRSHSSGLETLDALEALVRIALGAMMVVQTRQTLHLDLISQKNQGESPEFHSYGAAELPRTDSASQEAAIELAEHSSGLDASTAGRVALGMRWANVAFKQHDLLAFWTAFEILAGGRGQKVYVALARAYGYSPTKSQTFAKQLGLKLVYGLRGALAHDGCPIYMDVAGASYLNALVHDLARFAVGLPCLAFGLKAIEGKQVEKWFSRQE